MQNKNTREYIIKEIRRLVGDHIVDIELEPEDYDLALDMAFDRYRQKSSNALEESFVVFDVQPEVNTYTLPNEVQEVRSVYRRTVGGSSGGVSIDPFSLAFTNNLYMIQNPGGLGGGGSGTMATYDIAMQFQSLAGRLFGREVLYTWDPVSKRLLLHRRFLAVENIAVHVFNMRPDVVLFADPYARTWLRSYATAVCKEIMGEARDQFSSIAGPQGGIQMNGPAMKAEAKEMKEKLDLELDTLVDARMGHPFVIG